MKIAVPCPSSREEISNSFDLQPFSEKLTPIVKEVLKDEGKSGECRKGTFFTPLFTVFVTLGLTIRRDLNFHRVINWLLSKFRWEGLSLPAKIVQDGAVTHNQFYSDITKKDCTARYLHNKKQVQVRCPSALIFDVNLTGIKQ